MLLSRFWYALLGLVLGALVFGGYLAQSMYNRAGGKVAAEGLSADAQVVSWYMRNAARERSGQLLKFALNPKVSAGLAESNKQSSVPKKAREEVSAALSKLAAGLPKDVGFDALFAVDQMGRVVGQFGFEQTQGLAFELGGYPLVADALHGYVRDGSFVWQRLYLAVARPVESGGGELPLGAVVGLRTIDEVFAQDVSARTGAAIAFYQNGERVAAAVPDGFMKSDLAGIVRDIKSIESDKDYVDRGRSSLRNLTNEISAVYSRLPGEAWPLGAGYVVGRKFVPMATPLSFFFNADDKDKANANWLVVVGVALLAIVLGILFSLFEHTRPLRRFAALTTSFAAGKDDQLQASQVGGIFRKIATQINDGVDHAVAKGGGSRRAADLKSVLGEIPDKPAMSAFDFPDVPAVSSGSPERPLPAAPKRALPEPPPPRSNGNLAATMVEAGLDRNAPTEPMDEVQSSAAEWRTIYEEFVVTKRRCGEDTASLTYEKFEGTLRKNQAAIQDKHNVARVKFSVYVKEGRAALKASPIRE